MKHPWLLIFLLTGILASCKEKPQPEPEPEPQPEEAGMYVGGDISVLQSYEDKGVAYLDENGKSIPAKPWDGTRSGSVCS